MRGMMPLVLAWVLLPGVLQAGPKRRVGLRPNILLITIDTLRADHLSCYGYARQTSPNIDRLAAEGTLFWNAYTPIPLTGPSHISLMTALFPQQHGATINGMRMSTNPRPATLARILHRLGYKTAAFVSAWPLKKSVTGLGQGFDVYNQKFTYRYKLVNSARNASEVGSAARRWLKRKAREAFFLWVHYFDPHEPRVLHPEFADLPPAGGSPPGELRLRVLMPADRAERVTAYDSEIACADNDLGKMLQLLRELGLQDRTLIVLAADHGESLGEHNYVGHGDHVYQPIVRIPMIMSYTNFIPRGKTVSEGVSLLDVMPTILDYAGIGVRLPVEGRSLRPLIEQAGPRRIERPVYFVTYSEPPLLPPNWLSWIWTWTKTKRSPSRLGFVKGNLKVVSEGPGVPLRVYELQDAFTAEHPSATSQVQEAQLRDYRQQLAAWFKRTNRGLQPEGHLSEEDLEMLRSLGYVNP